MLSACNGHRNNNGGEQQQQQQRRPRRCYNCGSTEHLQHQCKKIWPAAATSMATNEAATVSKVGVTFSQQKHSANIPDTVILLDNQSTVDLFRNEKLLTNIREVPTWMVVNCNAGTIKTNKMGDLGGYGPVWFYPKALANILSLAQVRKKFLVEYLMLGVDRPMFVVNKPDGSTREFVETDTGLYVSEAFNAQTSGVALVNTVADNRANYTHDDYLRAEKS
jgi:hypothetical protein